MSEDMVRRAEEIAGKLTKRSSRALPKIGPKWTPEGEPGPKREDAYSLWWGRDGRHNLIDIRWANGAPSRWEYRLTAFGLQVRSILQGDNE